MVAELVVVTTQRLVPFRDLPRHVHIARHLDAVRHPQTTIPLEDLCAAFAALIMPGTITQAAKRLRWSRRMLESTGNRYLLVAMPPSQELGSFQLTLARLEWARIAYGIDPCWCGP